MQLNRFMWEDVEKGVFRKNKRIRTVLKFDNVMGVSSKNINQSNKSEFLDFLTIETNTMPDKSYEIKLIFSGDIIIKICTEVLDVTLDDQGTPWNSKTKPKEQIGTHPLRPFANEVKPRLHSQPNFLARGQLCNQIIDRNTANRMTPLRAQFTKRQQHKGPLMHSWMRQIDAPCS